MRDAENDKRKTTSQVAEFLMFNKSVKATSLICHLILVKIGVMIRKWIKKLLAPIIREVLKEEEDRIKEELNQSVFQTLSQMMDGVR